MTSMDGKGRVMESDAEQQITFWFSVNVRRPAATPAKTIAAQVVRAIGAVDGVVEAKERSWNREANDA